MTDRPILFSGSMVRALLAGTKTQTRRLITSARVFATPESRAWTMSGADLDRALKGADHLRRMDGNEWYWEADAFDHQWPNARTGWLAHIGYAPGDQLYVREAWHAACSLDSTPPRDIPRDADVEYAATARSYAEIGRKGRLRPGMHMPRWASRITLAVTDVRVQRLQDISEADALAEGVVARPTRREYWVPGVEHPNRDFPYLSRSTAREMYAALWDVINGSGSWVENPWVAAYTVTVAFGNIDQIGRAA